MGEEVRYPHMDVSTRHRPTRNNHRQQPGTPPVLVGQCATCSRQLRGVRNAPLERSRQPAETPLTRADGADDTEGVWVRVLAWVGWVRPGFDNDGGAGRVLGHHPRLLPAGPDAAC